MNFFNLKDKIISMLNYSKVNERTKASIPNLSKKAIDQFHLGNNYKENMTDEIE